MGRDWPAEWELNQKEWGAGGSRKCTRMLPIAPRVPNSCPPIFRRSPSPSRWASEPAGGANAPLEAVFLPDNSSAEAPQFPFASLFPEICYEELVQVKRLLSETSCAWWGPCTEPTRVFCKYLY